MRTWKSLFSLHSKGSAPRSSRWFFAPNRRDPPDKENSTTQSAGSWPSGSPREVVDEESESRRAPPAQFGPRKDAGFWQQWFGFEPLVLVEGRWGFPLLYRGKRKVGFFDGAP